jgi:hypothetical protein
LGINSAATSTNKVENKVCSKRVKESELMPQPFIIGSSITADEIPYITSEMLFPSNMKAMIFDSFL